MADQFTNEPMLDMYIFETSQLIEQLEQSILDSEKESSFSPASINEIFRIMHTIKGSSALMMFHNISTLAHKMEDIFYFLREEKPDQVDLTVLSDFVLDGVDFIKVEIEKIKNGDSLDGDASKLIEDLTNFLFELKSNGNGIEQTVEEATLQKSPQQFYISQEKVSETTYKYIYKAVIHFEDDCEMEHLRAYTVIHSLNDITEEYYHFPENIVDEECNEAIQKEGFIVFLKANMNYDEMNDYLLQTMFLKTLELTMIESEEEYDNLKKPKLKEAKEEKIKVPTISSSNDNKKKNEHVQSMISVSVSKLDKLMDLVGEMVIAEAMVTQNPDLLGLELENFQKASQQLNKITSELQDTVMSIRMVPLAPTFQKMHRIVRDMCKQLGKEVKLEIMGEETEVDKNIIEHISDPLMHLVRNALDHGIEASDIREEMGKEKHGIITLEAKNSGNDVLVIVRDNGKGLDKDRILQKAIDNELLYKKPEDMTDREIFNLVLLPGFSTKESVSEFSGRGVGMDVVSKNIESIGGTLSVDSVMNHGTTITLTIPLTLAIIDGMNIKVGNSCYTIPITSIKESLRPRKNEIITDPDGNEMIMIRGQCYPIIRLHKRFKVETKICEFTEGIIIIVEQDSKTICIFADELVGQQQVVVKGLPSYIQKIRKIQGLAGCTLLGDGSISLIIDVAGL